MLLTSVDGEWTKDLFVDAFSLEHDYIDITRDPQRTSHSGSNLIRQSQTPVASMATLDHTGWTLTTLIKRWGGTLLTL